MAIAFVRALLAKILQGIRAPHFAQNSQMARIPALLVAKKAQVPDILHAVQALRPIPRAPPGRPGISELVRTGILTETTSIIRAAILIRIDGLRIVPDPTGALIRPESAAATKILLFKISVFRKRIRLVDSLIRRSVVQPLLYVVRARRRTRGAIPATIRRR